MNAAEFSELLSKLGACKEARVWADGKSLAEAWEQCECGDWLLWLCARMQGKEGWPTRKQIVLAVCDCAEQALPMFEKKYPNDKRPRKAIETTKQWAQGEATIAEVYEARAAAASAIYSAAAASASDAAAAAAAAAASNAAAANAAAANAAAARARFLKHSAELIRKRLTAHMEILNEAA
jgi:hypothetical protein